MSNKRKKKSRKNLTEKIVLATAVFELIKIILEIIKELIE